jgi:hypothetical protein
MISFEFFSGMNETAKMSHFGLGFKQLFWEKKSILKTFSAFFQI